MQWWAFERGERNGGACPPGWVLYREAGGRFIIGAGQHSNDGLLSYPSYKDNPDKAIGGEERVVLGKGNLAAHDHGIWFSLAEGSGRPLYWYDNANANKNRVASPSHRLGAVKPTTGANIPHNNMPPYIALYFCKKN